MGLAEYRRKRDFTLTKEPQGRRVRSRGRKYVMHEHAASRLHYDFRLEHDGALLSWAVPKGPSLDPNDKRLAVRVEDHPVQYGAFEGEIEPGQYGAGSVLVWDRGSWIPDGDVASGLKKGKLDFSLRGRKLRGGWRLIRLRDRNGGDDKNWLLMKRDDDEARAGGKPITAARPESVASGRVIDEMGARSPKKKSPSRAFRAKGVRLRDLEGVRRARLPGFVPVQLATLVDAVPDGEGWIHEIKYDGYRMLVQVDRGKVTWFSRNGHDWTSRFEPISRAIGTLPVERALLDGEVVALDERGVSQFQGLQEALRDADAERLTYFAFDLLHLDGYDLRHCRLVDRKRALGALLERAEVDGPLRYGEHVADDGEPFLRAACSHALEGIVSKRASGTHQPRRTRDWLKIKCGQRQEFVVAGFTLPRGSRAGLGALVLAVREGRRWRHAGRVGTGFDAKGLVDLRARLDGLRRDESPFDETLAPVDRRGVLWVEPRIVAEVSFAGWTTKGVLRHASFEGLRPDKRANQVVRERPVGSSRRKRPGLSRIASAPPPKKRKRPAPPNSRRAGERDPVEVAGVTITHPDRVVDQQSGITKLDVARYYERVAERILPHVAGRPLSVVRCPDGFAKGCFFQKHDDGRFGAAVKSIALRDSGGRARYLAVDSLEGLIAIVQMNGIELHPWGSRRDDLEHPDVMVFDLDPGDGVDWGRVVEGAFHVRDVLKRMGIRSFAKTTGGKGVHVVVPLLGKSDWSEVKAFARAVAFEIARAQPARYVAVASKSARRGRIFIDYLRNGRGATAVAPYSARARAGAPVAVPISWKRLEAMDYAALATLVHDVAWRPPTRSDPWAAFWSSAQVLPKGSFGLGAVSRAAPRRVRRKPSARR